MRAQDVPHPEMLRPEMCTFVTQEDGGAMRRLPAAQTEQGLHIIKGPLSTMIENQKVFIQNLCACHVLKTVGKERINTSKIFYHYQKSRSII